MKTRASEKTRAAVRKEVIFEFAILALILLLGIAVAGYLKEHLIATSAEATYEEVAKEVVAERHASVDFATVHSYGSTATSWLYIPGTRIDYPLVQGINNDYYLDRDAYGNTSEAGAIFINFANASDMSDVKTVIFGHNMANGTMFTDLHNYAVKDYGTVHQDAYIYMESGEVKHYKLLYYIYTEPLDPAVYVVSSQDTGEYAAEELRKRSTIQYGEYSGNNLICLSTCTLHKYRTVVVFEYVDGAKPIAGSLKMEEELSEKRVSEEAVASEGESIEPSAESSNEPPSALQDGE